MDRTVKFRIELETKGERVFSEIRVSAEDFRNAVRSAGEEVKELGRGMDDLVQGGLVFSAVKEAVDVLSSSLKSLADQYNSFDQAMRAANTMAGEDRAGFKTLKREVEGLSKAIPLAREELAGGLYQVISNGVPKDNWIEYLNASARSAVGGIADLGQVVTVTSTLIKNYGMAWDDAESIQDKIQLTAKNGVTSFEQLAAALPRVAGNAATLGVSVDELMASFATLTGVSGNTAEVSTQLAAMFTALVKPTEMASQMAEEMGIRFDAAAIRAAGGMEGFLSRLTADVSRYAELNGVLETEIYGRLFGSAEAMRAFIPITGELADRFADNIAAMSDSAGTMSAAYDTMAGSGEAFNQKIQNQIHSMADWAGGVASSVRPVLSFLAASGQALMAFKLFREAAMKATAALTAYTAAHRKSGVVAAAAALHDHVRALALRMLTSVTRQATVSTWALNAAVTALYAVATMGISLAISALVSLFSSMAAKSKAAAEGLKSLKEANDAFKQTVSDARAELDMETASLRRLMAGQGDEKEAVRRLNEKYGETFGLHSTLSEWYDILTGKSRIYTEQLGYEAKARILASKKAEKEIERDAMQRQLDWMRMQQYDSHGNVYTLKEYEPRRYRKTEEAVAALNEEITELGGAFDSTTRAMDANAERLRSDTVKTTQAVGWERQSYADLGKTIDAQKKKVEALAGTDAAAARTEAALLAKMQLRRTALGRQYGLEAVPKAVGGGTAAEPAARLIEDARSYEEVANNIAFYERRLKEADLTDKEAILTIQKKINVLKRQQEAMREAVSEAGRPESLDTLEAIDQEIAYQQGLRRRASVEGIAGIDREIERLEDLKKAFEDVSKTVQKAPEDVSKLNTLADLDEAVGYYDEKVRKASASEIAGLSRTRLLLERKRDALARIAELPAMEREAAELGGLESGTLQLKLEVIGLDGVKDRIRSLQEMLDDTENPLGDGQRMEVERLIGAWKRYEAEIRRGNVEFKSAWGAVRGIGSAVETMTDALRDDVPAWKKVIAVIDGMFSLYDSVKGIAEIVQALTGVSRAHAAAKRTEAAATTIATVAETAAAAKAPDAAAAEVPVIAANKAAAASYLELASSIFFAAHAAIPFVGAALGAAFASMAAVTTKAIGAMAFASGGLVYGPTLGLVGEYAGAAGNPEVVAPLDRLRGIIASEAAGIDGKVEFRIKGRRLAGVLERESSHRRRNG